MAGARGWVGAAELEALLGVSRQRVQQIVNSADFPAPDVALRMGKAWRIERVREWAREHGRELHE